MNSQDLDLVFKRNSGKTAGVSHSRVRWFRIALGVFFAGLFLRLFWLQIIHGSRNRVLSEENRILARRIQAPRGVIYDRQGKVLAQNIPIYKKVVKRLCSGAVQESAASELDDKLLEDWECLEYDDISRDRALELEAAGRSGEVVTLVGRKYLFGPEISHLVGFVGEVSEKDLQENSDLRPGDLIGKAGVEMVYEDSLRGDSGAELVEVDAGGRVVREVAKEEPENGTDLNLTVDVELQQVAYDLLAGNKGALMALDPRSGGILTLVSRPGFDPNDVASDLNREDQPFFNRAIAGLYPPGSVFKPVVAIAGLEEGKVSESTEIEDTGEIKIGPYRYGNWYFDQYGRTEGKLDLVQAIKRSNDIFFYRVGEMVGATMMSEWAKVFGFGRETQVDLPGEAQGQVPSPEWKEKVLGEKWFLGNTYHFAIGQSDLQTTPLQVAQMTSAIANGGKLCRPYTWSGLSDENRCEEIGIEDDNLSLVVEGMREACLAGGTAFPFFNFGVGEADGFERIEVGCKTGTAEFSDPEGRTHAWFTVFAPFEDPEIVVTVILEGAGEGSYQAAPVARDYLKKYFEMKER